MATILIYGVLVSFVKKAYIHNTMNGCNNSFWFFACQPQDLFGLNGKNPGGPRFFDGIWSFLFGAGRFSLNRLFFSFSNGTFSFLVPNSEGPDGLSGKWTIDPSKKNGSFRRCILD
jgi:hypothetical protein